MFVVWGITCDLSLGIQNTGVHLLLLILTQSCDYDNCIHFLFKFICYQEKLPATLVLHKHMKRA